jgi:hypothetical protein
MYLLIVEALHLSIQTLSAPTPVRRVEVSIRR